MKTLILVRHAKATKAMHNFDDIDRPLVEKGILDAYKLAYWLKAQKCNPDQVICSPAVRAYSTGLIMARVLEYPFNKIKVNTNLYERGEEGYLEVISNVKDEYKCLMVFAHNPDISEFAMNKCSQIIDELPTTGVVGIDFKISHWEEINDTKGTLRFFEFPK